MIPLCTTTNLFPLSDLCGWEFTSDGTPWVAHLVCEMPTWTSCSWEIINEAMYWNYTWYYSIYNLSLHNSALFTFSKLRSFSRDSISSWSIFTLPFFLINMIPSSLGSSIATPKIICSVSKHIEACVCSQRCNVFCNFKKFITYLHCHTLCIPAVSTHWWANPGSPFFSWESNSSRKRKYRTWFRLFYFSTSNQLKIVEKLVWGEDSTKEEMYFNNITNFLCTFDFYPDYEQNMKE